MLVEDPEPILNTIVAYDEMLELLGEHEDKILGADDETKENLISWASDRTFLMYGYEIGPHETDHYDITEWYEMAKNAFKHIKGALAHNKQWEEKQRRLQAEKEKTKKDGSK